MFTDYSRRQKLILIIIAVAVLAALSFGLWRWLKPEAEVPPPDKDNRPTVSLNEVPVGAGMTDGRVASNPPSAQEKVATTAKQTATMFAERFGTYTNQSNYRDFTELRPLMTEAFAAWVNGDYVAALRDRKSVDGFFYRVVTLAAAARELEVYDDRMKFELQTQRLEQDGDQPEVSFQQKAEVSLIKSGEVWLVDSFVWGERR